MGEHMESADEIIDSMEQQLQIQSVAEALRTHRIAKAALHIVGQEEIITIQHEQSVTTSKSFLTKGLYRGQQAYVASDAAPKQQQDTQLLSRTEDLLTGDFTEWWKTDVWGGTFAALMEVSQRERTFMPNKISTSLRELFIRPDADPDALRYYIAKELFFPQLPF